MTETFREDDPRVKAAALAIRDYETQCSVMRVEPSYEGIAIAVMNALRLRYESAAPSWVVVVNDWGDKKIQVIKEVRTLTNLGLKEAKDIVVEGRLPYEFPEAFDTESDARVTANNLLYIGASVKVVERKRS